LAQKFGVVVVFEVHTQAAEVGGERLGGRDVRGVLQAVSIDGEAV
jgi:hypothetical protein